MKATAKIEINGVTTIFPDTFAGFRMYANMEEGLPYGYFQIVDRNADILAKFDNLQIGAEVIVSIVPNNSGEAIIEYPKFCILQIEDNCELDSSKFAGTIRVWFGHQWFLYKDIKNHAYKPMNNGELLKKILKNEDRGMAFHCENDNFSKTDDSGALARYKICETDWDFIQNKLLPYTSIKQMPAHFYSNEFSEFFLKSTADLYKENPKIVFTQKEEQAGKTTKELTKIMDDFGINKNIGHMPVQEASIVIGDPAILQEILPAFSLENNMTGKALSGTKKIANKAKARAGASFGNILPIDNSYMMTVTGTSTKIIHNRQLGDGMTLLFETGKHIDRTFSIIVETLFTGHVITLGGTAEIYMSDLMINEKLKKSWLNGKWLISGIEHFTSEEDTYTFKTRTRLTRPAFVGSDTNTTLSAAALMYEAP